MVAAVVLIVDAVFAAVIWPPFYRRIVADPRARDESGQPTRFLRVHQILIGAALLLALVSLVIGVLTLTKVTN